MVGSAARRPQRGRAGGEEAAGAPGGGEEEEGGAAGEGSSQREAGSEEGAARAGSTRRFTVSVETLTDSLKTALKSRHLHILQIQKGKTSSYFLYLRKLE